MSIPNASNSNVNIAESIIIDQSSAQRSDTEEQTEKSHVTQRLNEILRLINEHSVNKITIYQLSKLIGDEDPNDLVKYFSGEEFPSFAYAEKLCHRLSLDDRWIWGNGGSPFFRFGIDPLYPLSSYNKIKDSHPKHIYFLLSDTPEKKATIILELSSYNFQLVSDQWHLNLDHVGSTGQSQIVSFYKLICRLYRRSYCDCSDYLVPEAAWNDLMRGEIWPGSFSYAKQDGWLKKPSHWADDLRDLDHNYAPNYEELYGGWFVRTQAFIKERLRTQDW